VSGLPRAKLLVSVLVATAALIPSSSASASVTIGATFDPGTSSCGNFLLQSVSPGNGYSAPSDGVITSWSYQASATAGQLKLKVADPEGNNQFTVVGESDVETATANMVNTFLTRISVSALDVIGITPVTNGIPCIRGMAAGYSYSAFVMGADVPPGSTGTFNPPASGVQIDVAAALEPDADDDGFGDESQDQCLGSGGSTDGCPVVADTDPPEARITKGVPNRTEKTKVKIRFVSDEPNSTFECKADQKPFSPCASPKTLKRLDEGKHVFKVRAIDAAGNVDQSPAKDKFKVVE